jgi:hypothetical protein
MDANIFIIDKECGFVESTMGRMKFGTLMAEIWRFGEGMEGFVLG